MSSVCPLNCFLRYLDCNAIFYGCNECSLRNDSDGSIQCDSCDFGYFLLTVATSGTPSESMSDETRLSMCV